MQLPSDSTYASPEASSAPEGDGPLPFDPRNTRLTAGSRHRAAALPVPSQAIAEALEQCERRPASPLQRLDNPPAVPGRPLASSGDRCDASCSNGDHRRIAEGSLGDRRRRWVDPRSAPEDGNRDAAEGGGTIGTRVRSSPG
jgi:hypothetical protein